VKRSPETLGRQEYDLLIIGGGLFGACAAWDAALSGLSVALLERNDFASATSAHSFRMVHGGIRYLQHLDLPRIRQSSHERRALLRVAPHLVHPLPIVIPTYGNFTKSRHVLRIGGWIYDAIAFDRNKGIHDPLRTIPKCTSLPRKRVLDLFPGLIQEQLTGALVFHDGQMYNPPRLVLGFLRSADEAGATIANYVEVEDFLRDGSRVYGVTAHDRLCGTRMEIRARLILNASGPFAEHLLRTTLGLQLSPPGSYSRDACFVVGRRLFDHDHGLAVLGATSDPDALLSRGARHLFLVPWTNRTLVGVWHRLYHRHPDTITVTRKELGTYLQEINGAYPGLRLEEGDVVAWNAGLVPFGENEAGSTDLRYGHRTRLIDHEQTHGVRGLITLIGVRMTTARAEAERAIGLAFRKLGRPRPKCKTDRIPIHGGRIQNFSAWSRDMISRRPAAVSAKAMEAMLRNYGTGAEEVIALLRDDPSLSEPLGDSTVLRAELLHAIREEMATCLADVVYRRTDLATPRRSRALDSQSLF